MCVVSKPIYNNKSFQWNNITDRLYNFCSCGKCHQCLSMREDSFVVRCIAHYNDIVQKGGECYFYTLTYAPAYVPKYQGLMCFSGRDLDLFRKRMQKIYQGFQMFVTSEYGNKFTERPHYHALFFFPYKVNSYKLRENVTKSWIRVKGRGKHQLSFSLGFNKPGNVSSEDNKIGKVYSVIACKYVCKYLTKDVQQISHFLNIPNIKDIVKDSFKDSFFKKNKLSLYPIFRAPRGFGISLLDRLSDSDFLNGYFYFSPDKFNFTDVNKSGQLVKHCIPLYIYRKKCYKVIISPDRVPLYRLNDYGLRLKSLNFRSKISDFILKYRSVIEDNNDFFFCGVYSQYIRSLLSNVNPFKFANYVLFYRFLPNVSLYDVYGDYDMSRHFPIYVKYYNDFKSMSHINVRGYIFDSHYELCYKLMCVYLAFFKYKDYKKRVNEYNVDQYNKSQESGVYNPQIVKTFEQYVSLNSIIFNSVSINQLKKPIERKKPLINPIYRPNSYLSELSILIVSSLKKYAYEI